MNEPSDTAWEGYEEELKKRVEKEMLGIKMYISSQKFSTGGEFLTAYSYYLTRLNPEIEITAEGVSLCTIRVKNEKDLNSLRSSFGFHINQGGLELVVMDEEKVSLRSIKYKLIMDSMWNTQFWRYNVTLKEDFKVTSRTVGLIGMDGDIMNKATTYYVEIATMEELTRFISLVGTQVTVTKDTICINQVENERHKLNITLDEEGYDEL